LLLNILVLVAVAATACRGFELFFCGSLTPAFRVQNGSALVPNMFVGLKGILHWEHTYFTTFLYRKKGLNYKYF